LNRYIYKLKSKIKNTFIRQQNSSSIHSYWQNPPIDSTGRTSNRPERYADENLLPRSKFIFDVCKNLISDNDHIIELGCGIGRNLNYFQSKGYKNLYGIEINVNAVSKMNIIYPNLKDTVKNIIAGKIEENIQKFPKDFFHLVFTMATLQHIHKDYEKYVFNEISRICGLYLVIVEDELTVSDRHFLRNYRKVFIKLGFNQIDVIEGVKIINANLPVGYICRIFKKGE